VGGLGGGRGQLALGHASERGGEAIFFLVFFFSLFCFFFNACTPPTAWHRGQSFQQSFLSSPNFAPFNAALFPSSSQTPWLSIVSFFSEIGAELFSEDAQKSCPFFNWTPLA